MVWSSEQENTHTQENERKKKVSSHLGQIEGASIREVLKVLHEDGFDELRITHEEAGFQKVVEAAVVTSVVIVVELIKELGAKGRSDQ